MAENRGTNASSRTPPACKHGVKNEHSPWSAPRERKRRPVVAHHHLCSIEEADGFTISPPKRRNGATSPAARELAMHPPPMPLSFCLPADKPAPPPAPAPAQPAAARAPPPVALPLEAVEPGPLAQGLLAPPAAEEGFSPLASGLAARSFEGSLELGRPNGAPAPERQRRQVRQASSWRLAQARQQRSSIDAGQAAGAGAPAVAAGQAAGADAAAAPAAPSQPPTDPSVFSSWHWQPAIAAAAAGGSQPVGLQAAAAFAGPQQLPPPPQQQQHSNMEEQCEPCELPLPASHPASPHGRQQAQAAAQAAAAGGAQLGGSQPMHHRSGGVGRASSGQGMDTDLRSSWGSERSADVAPWQSLQARLRDGAAGDAAALRQQASGGTDDSDARMRGSREGAASLDGRSSMDGGATCSERQTSQLPLRAAMRAHWHSHMTSSPTDPDGVSPDPLLGRSSGSRKQRSRGINPKWSCFSCASPFGSCKQGGRGGGAGGTVSDGEDEIVRRNGSEEFVIRRKQSFASIHGEQSFAEAGGSPDAQEPDASEGRRSSRPKHSSLNRPPSGDALVNREGGFSARCTPPGVPWSPCSEAGSGDSFSLASGPPAGLRSISVGLRDGSIEDVGGGGEGGGSGGCAAPTVDALNDMLKSLSLCASAHPKDAEALVAQACADHAIEPNATTARTLEKLWAVHEQLYG